MAQVTVTINGKNYRMACEDGQEEHLQGLARSFDANIRQLHASFGEIGDQRLTVMAGVMALDEVSELKTKVALLEQDLETARGTKAAALERMQHNEAALTQQIDTATALITELAERLNTQ